MKSDLRVVGLCLFLGCLLTSSVAVAREPSPKKLQVFILAGQSNMVGHCNYITIQRLLVDPRPEVRELAKLVFKKGSTVTAAKVNAQMATRLARDRIVTSLREQSIQGEKAIAAAEAKVKALQAQYDQQTKATKKEFAVSDRVYISSIADGNRKSGPLTIGFGGNRNKIGPELGFGMSLARKIKSPILIIKTSWGGKSLHYNFRPPSAGPYVLSEKEKASPKADKIKTDAGLNYRLMTAKVKEVLGKLKDYHPQFDESAGYELAGFVWFQGFNDQFSPAFHNNYKDNMIAFVEDIRKEYKVPKMPFVIGVLGTGMAGKKGKEQVDTNAVTIAQRQAAAAPQFKGNLTAVESYRDYDLSALKVFRKGWKTHFAEWCAVGSDRPYHYLGSGKFFIRFGDSLATAMADLIKKQ